MALRASLRFIVILDMTCLFLHNQLSACLLLPFDNAYSSLYSCWRFFKAVYKGPLKVVQVIDMTSIKPFQISIPDETLEQISEKVSGYNWHYMPDDGGWSYGTNLDYMKELCAYWVEEYDWRRHESMLNRFPQFTASVDGIDIHFIHKKGSGLAATPLLISHGWPGSIAEFDQIIEPLAHPERFGGCEEDAFDVIAPSLPGFGFSGRPSRPMGPRGPGFPK